MEKIIKLNSSALKKIIREEIEKSMSDDNEKMSEDIANSLKRYKIDDLEQELKDNYIGRTRIMDIVRFFRKYLGDGPYYVINNYSAKQYELGIKFVRKKEIEPESDSIDFVKLKKNYRPRRSNTYYSLYFGYGKIKNGPEFPIIVQEDMNDFSDNSYRYYVNDDFLGEYL